MPKRSPLAKVVHGTRSIGKGSNTPSSFTDVGSSLIVSLQAFAVGKASRPQFDETRLGVDATDDCRHLRCRLGEAPPPRAEARDDGDVQVEDAELVTEQVAVGCE